MVHMLATTCFFDLDAWSFPVPDLESDIIKYENINLFS